VGVTEGVNTSDAAGSLDSRLVEAFEEMRRLGYVKGENAVEEACA
jgi:hypothetical protein